jgi:hypothetical protein
MMLDITAVLHFRDQACAFGLRFPLAALEGMPFAVPDSILVDVENDCPTTG